MKRKQKKRGNKWLIDAGSLAQRKKARIPMTRPGFVMKSKKDYDRKNTQQKISDETGF